MLKAIIYDFDGTVGETLDVHLLAYKTALSKLGIKLTDKEVVQNCFHKNDDTVCRQFGLTNKLELFSRHYREKKIEEFEKVELYPHIMETIKKLKEMNLKVALCSQQPGRYVEPILKRLEIRNVFDSIVLNHDTPITKFQIVEKVLNIFKIRANNVLLVGDSDSDLEAANILDMQSALYYPKANEKFYDLNALKSYKPNYIIKNHKEIIKKIKL